MGRINFGGVIREASLAFVPEARRGDYVIVHVGCALSVIDEEEALQIFQYINAMRDDSVPGGP